MATDRKVSISQIKSIENPSMQDTFVISHTQDEGLTYDTTTLKLSTLTDVVLSSIQYDEVPTSESQNLVNSGNIKSYVDQGDTLLKTDITQLSNDLTSSVEYTAYENAEKAKEYAQQAQTHLNVVNEAKTVVESVKNELADTLEEAKSVISEVDECQDKLGTLKISKLIDGTTKQRAIWVGTITQLLGYPNSQLPNDIIFKQMLIKCNTYSTAAYLRIFKVVDNTWVLMDYVKSSTKLSGLDLLNGAQYLVFNFTNKVVFNKDEKIRIEIINHTTNSPIYNNPGQNNIISYTSSNAAHFFELLTHNSQLKVGYGFTTSDSVNPELSSFNYSVFQHQTTIYVDNTIDEILKTDQQLDSNILYDKRLNKNDSSLYPLVVVHEHPLGQIYQPLNRKYACVYFCDNQYHIFMEYVSSAPVYSGYVYLYTLADGIFVKRFVGACKGSAGHDSWYHGIPVCTYDDKICIRLWAASYNENKIIFRLYQISTGELLAESIHYRDKETEYQLSTAEGDTGALTRNPRTGHFIQFGRLLKNIFAEDGTVTQEILGYGYYCFNEDLEFVKYDSETDTYITSDTLTEEFFTVLPSANRIADICLFRYEETVKVLFVAIPQATNTTNGVFIFGEHDELVDILSLPTPDGINNPYKNLGYIPCGGAPLTTYDKTPLTSKYLPIIVYGAIQPDTTAKPQRNIIFCNGARMMAFALFNSYELVPSYNNITLNSTNYKGVQLDPVQCVMLLGNFKGSYQGFGTYPLLYDNTFCYDYNGNSFPIGSWPGNSSRYRAMRTFGGYARSSHIVFASVGNYNEPTGALRVKF